MAACGDALEAVDFCSFEMEDLFECHGESGVVWEEGEPASPEACATEEADLADCVAGM